jgi:hypothetical protein
METPHRSVVEEWTLAPERLTRALDSAERRGIQSACKNVRPWESAGCSSIGSSDRVPYA